MHLNRLRLNQPEFLILFRLFFIVLQHKSIVEQTWFFLIPVFNDESKIFVRSKHLVCPRKVDLAFFLKLFRDIVEVFLRLFWAAVGFYAHEEFKVLFNFQALDCIFCPFLINVLDDRNGKNLIRKVVLEFSCFLAKISFIWFTAWQLKNLFFLEIWPLNFGWLLDSSF